MTLLSTSCMHTVEDGLVKSHLEEGESVLALIGRAVPFSSLLQGNAQNGKTKPDVWLFMIIAALSCFGLVMVYSASDALGFLWYGNANYFFDRQIVYFTIGLVAMVAVSRIDYHILQRFVKPIALISAIMLVAVLIPHVGAVEYGARRWFKLGSLLIQPSSIATLCAIIVFGHWLVMKRSVITTLPGVRDYCILFGVLLGLVLLEKDMGTTMVIAAVGLTLLYFAGARGRHLVIVVALLGIATVLMIKMESYRGARISNFTNPFAAARTTGYQSVQSFEGFGSGGLFGVGLGNSIQKYGWLPSAQTDYIFAIIGEELGLLGTAAVVAAFTFLMIRGLRAARRAPDLFGTLLAAGITAWVGFDAFVNMASVTGVSPTIGIPLPFISYGGSDLVMTLVAMGILLNVASQGQRKGVTQRAHRDRWWGNWRPFDSGPRARSDAPRELSRL